MLCWAERWETHKILLRDAALHARDQMLAMEEFSDFSIQSTISTIARTIWSNNTKVARIIMEQSSFARKHITVFDDTVQLIDAVAFDDEVSEHKRTFLANSAERLEASAKHPRTNAKNARKSIPSLRPTDTCQAVAQSAKTAGATWHQGC